VNFKKIIGTIICVALCTTIAISGVVSAVGATGTSTTLIPEIPSDEVLLSAIQENVDAWAEHYDINSVSVTDKRIQQGVMSGYSVDFTVGIDGVLAYESAAQLPHVQGLIGAIGVFDMELSTQGLIAELENYAGQNAAIAESDAFSSVTATSAEQINSSQRRLALTRQKIALKAVDIVENLEAEHIGATNTILLEFRAFFDADDVLTNVCAVAYDGSNYNADLLKPQSIEEMRANGETQYEEILSVAESEVTLQLNMSHATTNAVTAVAATPVYHRVTARNYANAWTSTPTGGASKDTTKWRTSNNPNATAPLYPANNSDCANYVSQAIFAGGIPKTDTSVSDAYHWFASQYGCSAAWENVGHMYTFFYTYKGYWSTSSFANCNAGGVIFYKDSSGDRYHVVMCVQNDTVDRKYSAHTTDKKEVTYTDSTSFGAYSVEYFVFTSSQQD
jgi:RNA polymerase sigma-70 factor (ECF subfamily)